MSKIIREEGIISGKKLILEKGALAFQATSAVKVQYGDTVVLASLTISDAVREDVNYLPLLVDYEEKMYAAGKIKGSRFIKREGRPTDEAILVSRLIDRTLRPLFNPQIRNDIQFIVTVLSLDPEADSRLASVIAAGAALVTSGIPLLYGPVAAVRLAEKEGQPVVNPAKEILDASPLDLLVSGTEEKVNMIEASGQEVPEDKMVELISLAHKKIKKFIEIIEKFKNKCGEILPQEMIYAETTLSEEMKDKIGGYLSLKLDQALFGKEKPERQKALKKLLKELQGFLGEINEDEEKLVATYFQSLLEERGRRAILKEGQRVDGRKMDELRPLSCQVGVLPRAHGSAIFQRGLTQALSVVTLGAPGDEQLLDTMEEEGSKRYFHHYNFPPYAPGEVAPMRGPGRREIGHGALAEKAIALFLPNKEEFPYTTRVVTEILSSNGSTSMAAVCASSLSLMDAGVPLKKAVAGIAVGVMFSPDRSKYQILTDIQGVEDSGGDMDFKVAGTSEGISAIQMDVKMEGLSPELFPEIFKEARVARLKILARMNRVIAAPRKDLSPYAPRIVAIQINPEKIREVIGPGGKTINAIINETGVDIDIEDSGLVMVTSADKEAAAKAVEWIKNLTREVKVGETFKARITRLMDFGAFAEVLPGQEGLIHISEIAPFRIERVDTYLKVGQVVPVKVIEIDDLGRVNLSCKNLLKLKPKEETPRSTYPQKHFPQFLTRRRKKNF